MKKGSKMSDEQRAKVSEGLRKKYQESPEFRAKQKAAVSGSNNPHFGKTLPAEARAKISAANKGKKLSEGHIAALRAAHKGNTYRIGIPNSPETRAKVSAGNKGKRRTPETCTKISEARQGWTYSEETLAKMSDAHKNYRASPETRVKLSKMRRGEGNANWRGGASFGRYCIKFNREFKERVREFFGRVCAECGAPENGRKHDVHHVNFHKDSCCAEDVEPLFVPLCVSCHAKTQHNREYYEAHFTAMINEQYDGRCYLPKPDTEGS